jgi:hypothetical protein
MAVVTRVNGGAHGVVNMDRGTSGSGAISADETVIISLPQMDFFKIIVENGSQEAVDLRNELDAGEAVEAVLRKIGDLANVEMYQVEGDTTGQMSVAVYPAGAYTASSLQTAIRALGTTVGNNTVDVSGSDVTDGGFKLA